MCVCARVCVCVCVCVQAPAVRPALPVQCPAGVGVAGQTEPAYTRTARPQWGDAEPTHTGRDVFVCVCHQQERVVWRCVCLTFLFSFQLPSANSWCLATEGPIIQRSPSATLVKLYVLVVNYGAVFVIVFFRKHLYFSVLADSVFAFIWESNSKRWFLIRNFTLNKCF